MFMNVRFCVLFKIWVFTLTFMSFGVNAHAKAPNGEGVVVYKNGAIYTVSPRQPWAQALVIKNGVIKWVGSNQQAKLFEKGALVIDLAGKMVMPGFHDVHIHPIESGSNNNHFALDYLEDAPENYIADIKKAASDFPREPWLVGSGHDINTLMASERNPLDILDEAVPDRPVIVMEQTSHSMWVNSNALALLGFDENSKNPVGGVILKDEYTGHPNGLLIDNAGEIAMHLAMKSTYQRRQNDYDGMVNYTLPAFAQHGITSIVDARAYWRRGHVETWLKLEKDNALTVRASVGLWAYPEDDDLAQLKKLASLYRDSPNSLLRINQIKLYSDGIPVNTTAALKGPYAFDLLGLPGNNGLSYFTEPRLAHYIKVLEKTGFDFNIHAIGDRGIHQALNAIEKGGSSKGRHRLTHLEIVDPKDIKRFAKLNVTADCQVAGEFTHPSHWPAMAQVVGAKKAQNLVPIKSFNDAGARVTLSSDWSVSPFNPFIGLQNALTRAPQNLSLQDAIAAYTINSAFVMRQEKVVGSLEVGKEADLVVLDQNLFKVPITHIRHTKVLQTLLNGEEVYRSEEFEYQ
jgi:predicted amidohydrolase YtcJ